MPRQVQRVQPEGDIDAELRPHRQHLVKGVRHHRRHDGMADPASARQLPQLRTVGRKLRRIQMQVGIDKRHRQSCCG
ncbi:hypothetical protein D3C85_1668520 [compost metagenome]